MGMITTLVVAAVGAAAAYAYAGSAPAAGLAGAALAVLALFLAPKKSSGHEAATAAEVGEVVRRTWDYIVVGGGTAGCVIANRLTAAGKKVLILEAGRADYDATLVRMPAGLLRLFKSKYDWDFTSSNEAKTSGRGIYLPRGKVLGGSSALNVLLYNRGDANDFNLWEEKFGCQGWKADDVLPYFKRTEDNQTGLAKSDPKHHSTGGEWSVDHVRYQNPLSKRFLEACKQMGLPRNDDFNSWGHKQEGAGRFFVSERKGSRCSAASAMLEPALKDKKRCIKVLCGSPVQRILFPEDGVKAAGVHFTNGGTDHIAHLAPGGEVLLTGGAIHSPQLLMLSGLGPAKHLEEHGIKVVRDLPGVGENLQDHPAATVSYQCSIAGWGASTVSKIRLFGTKVPHPKAMLEWLLFGSGPLTSPLCDHGGFFYTPAASEGAKSPDLQMRFLAARAPMADGMKSYCTAREQTNHPDGMTFQSIAVRPHSRGRVCLASANPREKPIIEGNYLTDERDMATIREGLRLSRKIAKQPAFAKYLGHEVFPGSEFQTDAQLNTYIASTVHTANALVGTCRMGQASDPQAVCDPAMRVHRVTGLRVCDSSVMPQMPGGQTGAPTVMIAERAAEMILKAGS